MEVKEMLDKELKGLEEGRREVKEDIKRSQERLSEFEDRIAKIEVKLKE